MIKFTLITYRHQLYYLFILFLSANAFTQTGPGGVGSNDGTSTLEYWVDANSGVTGASPITAWNDLSGNSITNTILGNPSITANSLNDYDVLTFDGTGDYISTSLNISGNTFPQCDIYAVYKMTGTSSAVWGEDNGSYDRFLVDANGAGGCTGSVTTGGSRVPGCINSPSLFPSNTPVITSVQFSEDESNGSSTIVNGANILTFTSNHEDETSNDFDVGSIGRINFLMIGDIAEVFVFSEKLNLAKQIILHNHLSAKYNVALTANDFYDEDTSGENFDHKVAGIGQATDGSNHTDSKGTGIIQINTPSSLSNDDYLFWGEESKNPTYNFTTNTTIYTEQLNSKWRVSKRNDLGTVSLSFNASDLDLTGFTCGNLQLVIDDSSDFSSPINTYTLNLSGGVYTATGVNFNDNNYFTIQYANQIVLDGATAYNGSGTSNKPNTDDDCFKLLVKSNTLTLSENADVREIEVEASSILAVNSSIRLQVTNGINNSGDIRLIGTSQLIQTHTSTANLNTGSGNLYIDQTANTSTVYQSGYWSSPVSATVGGAFSINDVLKDGSVPTTATATAGEAADIDFIGGLDGNGASSPIEISTRWLATFNNAADWTRFVSPTGTVLTPGLGWNMKSVGSTFTFKGIANDGEYSFSIAENNYSLLGNPYPSAIDAEAFITENSGEFNGELYIYNSASDNTHVRGSYTGTYSTIISGVSVGTGRYLPIGQAFFVTREVAGSGTLTFRNSQRTLLNLGDTDGIIARATEEKKVVERNNILPVLKIGFEFDLSETQTRKREVAVVFRGLTDGYDMGYDAAMWGLQPTDLHLTVAGTDSPFIITGVESFNSSLQIPLVVMTDIQREVTFTINEKTNINTPVYLVDTTLDITYDLNEDPEVVINLEPGVYKDRFFITFSTNTLSTTKDDIWNNLITIFENTEKQLVIKNRTNLTIENVKIYSLLGTELYNLNTQTNSEKLTLDISKLASTIYIVSIKTEKGFFNKKIVLD